MGNDRVAAVYDLGVIAALVEHTHIHTQDVCQSIRHGSYAPSSGLMIIIWSAIDLQVSDFS